MTLLSNSGSQWATPVLTCSAITGQGVATIWDHINEHYKNAKETGTWDQRRSEQQVRWMWSLVEDRLIHRLKNHSSIAQTISATEEEVQNGDISATSAAEKILELFRESS